MHRLLYYVSAKIEIEDFEGLLIIVSRKPSYKFIVNDTICYDEFKYSVGKGSLIHHLAKSDILYYNTDYNSVYVPKNTKYRLFFDAGCALINKL